MDEEVSNMVRREAWMRDNPKGGELDPADDVHRRCKKNSPSVLFCLGVGDKRRL